MKTKAKARKRAPLIKAGDAGKVETRLAAGLLDKRGAAARLGIGIRGLEGLMARKAISYYSISHKAVRFSEDQILAFLEKVRVSGPGSSKN